MSLGCLIHAAPELHPARAQLLGCLAIESTNVCTLQVSPRTRQLLTLRSVTGKPQTKVHSALVAAPYHHGDTKHVHCHHAGNRGHQLCPCAGIVTCTRHNNTKTTHNEPRSETTAKVM